MEGFTMARRSMREYLRSIYKRYQRAPRAEKGMILEEFCKVCGYNRKYAIWLLNRPVPEVAARKRTLSRSPTCSQAMVRILAKVWQSSGYLCSQRLKAALVHWLPWIKQHFELTQPLEAQLLAISARQMDRRLRATKHIVKRRLYGTTRPGSLLKQMIPIKTNHWDVNRPGYLEIDLVSHSGASAVGEYLHSLDCVDIATCWVERKAVMGKSALGILNAVTEIEHQLPFRLKGIDSDNGSEFINNHLLAFCQQRPAGRTIQFTRSRPYKKDDNAHIEQKNWTHVRKLMGWDRYNTAKAPDSFAAMTLPAPRSSVLWSPEREIAKSWQHWLTRLRQPTPSSSPAASISNWSNSTSWPAMQTEHRGKGHRCNRPRGETGPSARNYSANNRT